jgi:hypothetical protein
VPDGRADGADPERCRASDDDIAEVPPDRHREVKATAEAAVTKPTPAGSIRDRQDRGDERIDDPDDRPDEKEHRPKGRHPSW